MAIIKVLKSEKINLNIEFLDDLGKLTKRKQPILFLSDDATDDEKYKIAKSVGAILVSPPKTIEDTFVYELMEV